MEPTTNWSLIKKISFRLFFVYCLLFCLPFPIDIFESLEGITTFYDNYTWKSIIPVVSEHIFNIPYDSLALPLGSGDTTYNYIQLFCFVIIMVLITVIWSFIDRKRKNYKRLLQFLVIFLVYYVMYAMFSYGFHKVYKLQFPDPSLYRMLKTYGESSPMGIAWTFMGASKGYTIFSGWAEVVGGLLLIFRRTRTLGGLVCFGVMLNIFVMNMCYDIPVKIYSFHLMLFAFFIFMQDWKRLFSVFFTTTNTTARSFPKYFDKLNFNIGALLIKIFFVGFFLYSSIAESYETIETYNINGPKPALYGIYNTQSVIKNKDTIPLLITDDQLWKRVVIQSDKYVLFYDMEDDATLYNVKSFDTIQHTMNLVKREDSTAIFNLNYTLKDSILTLQGTHKGDTLHIEAKQYDLKKLRLINRGFHWINEYPYNR